MATMDYLKPGEFAINFDDAYILIINGRIENISQVLPFLEFVTA